MDISPEFKNKKFMKINWGTVLSSAIGAVFAYLLVETVLKKFLDGITENFSDN